MKISSAILLMILFHINGNAKVVSPDTAQMVAINFYQTATNSHSPLTATLNFTQSENDGNIDFYVFDIDNGFVIVSATDQVTPVLAYSTETNFRADYPEIGISSWIKHTAAGIHQAALQNISAAQVSAAWSVYLSGQQPVLRNSIVSPMLTTTWAQSPFYNSMCPYDSANHGRSVTGCVATAMAQIMKFWSYPAQGIGSYSYVDSQHAGYSYNIGRLNADFGATSYLWSQMPLSLTDDNAPIATLMYQCGVSMAMNYSAHGSAAYLAYPGHPSALNSFTSYFGYDAHTIKYVQKTDYTPVAWQSMIENELMLGRPVLYSGQDTGNIGGHAWVCDGYDATGMLHMNWGWGGSDNGYFLTTDLNPGAENWDLTQTALIGIQPDPTLAAITNVPTDPAFKLYPNPAVNKINISGTNSPTDYMIFDLMGQRISAGLFTETTNIITVNGWAPGVYFIKLQSGSQQSTHRFVVER